MSQPKTIFGAGIMQMAERQARLEAELKSRALEEGLRATLSAILLQRPAYRGSGCFCDGFHDRDKHGHQDKCSNANTAIDAAKALLAEKPKSGEAVDCGS